MSTARFRTMLQQFVFAESYQSNIRRYKNTIALRLANLHCRSSTFSLCFVHSAEQVADRSQHSLPRCKFLDTNTGIQA